MRVPLSLALRALVPALLLAGLVACADDDDDADPGNTPTGSPTQNTDGNTGETPTPEPSPTEEPGETPTPSPAMEIAVGPEHFLYVVAEGDTLESIAAMFDAQAGEGGFLTAEEIGDLNGVDDGDLEPGMLLAIPALPSSAEAIMAENTIEEALGVGQQGSALVLLQPSRELIDGYLGRVALYRVALESPDGGEPGYVMEYWFTERQAFRGGVVDADARYTSPAFTVAGGSLAGYEDEESVDSHTFDRDGVEYTLLTYADTQHDAETTAGMLSTAAERQ